MKYAYYTNLVFGILGVLFQAFIGIAAKTNDDFFKGDTAKTVGEVIGLCFFGIMGIMLLVSASKIKNKMKLDIQSGNFMPYK